jgi:hypothetical protein
MMPRCSPVVCFFLALAATWSVPTTVVAGPGLPPNWVPELSFSYVDPVSGERLQCEGDCRRFEVPAGVDLEVRVRVRNVADGSTSDPVSWDLWFDQSRRPFVGEDISVCWGSEGDGLHLECWQAMLDRVDWQWWNEQVADRVCVPAKIGDCVDDTLVVPVNPGYEGSRGRGVYAFMVWVDRFAFHAESDEFDNVAGPVRVKVVQLSADETMPPHESDVPVGEKATTGAGDSLNTIISPQTPKPYGFRARTTEIEESFTLGSRIARANVPFVPAYPGVVEVEVNLVGVWEAMTLELRKISTGEILFETSGKGNLRISGRIGKADLKDDRRLEVVVRQGHGTRGLRGTIRVSYPDGGVYVRGE